MTGTLRTIELPLNTACLAFSPGEQEGRLAVGSYQLSACRNVRQGRLHILAIADSHEEGLRVEEECGTDLPGIFDMKWNKVPGEVAQLGLALSDGSVTLFTPSWREGSLGPPSSLLVGEGSLSTCIDFSPRDAGTLAVSTANGQLGLAQVTESTLTLKEKWQGHELETWCCAFPRAQADLIISGADDCALKTWDIRSLRGSPSSVNSSGHTAGICCIQPSPLQDFGIYTGCYDERIRSWDLRNLSAPVGQIEVNGGVWRMMWHPAKHDYLVAACMHNGCAIIRSHSPEMEVIQRPHIEYAYQLRGLECGDICDVVVTNGRIGTLCRRGANNDCWLCM